MVQGTNATTQKSLNAVPGSSIMGATIAVLPAAYTDILHHCRDKNCS